MKKCLLYVLLAALLLSGCNGSASSTAPAATSTAPAANVSAAPSTTAGTTIKEPSAETTKPRTTPTPTLGTIGVLLPTLDTAYYMALLARIEENAVQHGFDIMAHAADWSGDMDKALAAALASGVRSVIIDLTGIDEAGVSAIQSRCLAAGVPCVMLRSDEAAYERNAHEGRAVTISLPAKGLGMYMMNHLPKILGGTLDILDGRLLIIGSDPDSPTTKENVAGLYFDFDGLIKKRKNIKILKTLYMTDKAPLDTLVSAALTQYGKVDTFICIDRNLSADLLRLLQAAGFHGNLLCYVDETTADQMETVIDGTRVVYVYCSIAEIAEESVRSAMTQALFGKGYDGKCYFSCKLSKTAQ